MGVCDDKLSVTAGIDKLGSYEPSVFKVQQSPSLDKGAEHAYAQLCDQPLQLDPILSHSQAPCKGSHHHEVARSIAND